MIYGKRCIVTGGASGIGRAIAQRFVAEGASVLSVDRNPHQLFGGFASYVLAQDVAAPGAAQHIVDTARKLFGGVDVLVNNAGVSAFEPLETHSDEVWSQTMAVNVDAVFRLCRAAAPHLKLSGRGRIINLGSVMSSFGDKGMVAYAAAKHAVLGMTKALAAELGEFGVTVNCIQPGAILTGITEPTFKAMPEFEAYWREKAAVKRIGRPEDIAAMAAFLASDEASFVSGHGVFVDGGAMQHS